MTMELLLYHYFRSSSSWRVRWGLAIKGLSYGSRPVDLLANEQNDEGFRRASPMGLVPCLVIDGRPLTESVAILEWLEETIPSPPLLPRDPWARARVRQLVELINAGTQPLQNIGVLRRYSPDKESQKAWARLWIERGLQAVERELEVVAAELGEGAHAVGDAITLADLFIVPQLANARRYGADLVPYPRACAVEVSALDTKAARASHPDHFAPPP
jgi:maleylacetoacetate isomerase